MKSMSVQHRKRNQCRHRPLVSVILLDWSVRERFHALEWLLRQDAPRESYELIWIELYDRVVPEAMEYADAVITLGQRGVYQKHMAYNIGLLEAQGSVLTICDSDAVFPPDFIDSIVQYFKLTESERTSSHVLMHYEWRNTSTYPDALKDVSDLSAYEWLDLWPNVGACMSVYTEEALRFGGFDEHRSYRGYLCGPYELGWRMVNAGIPETWHDESVALWHFAHPDPHAAQAKTFSFKRWREITYPHVDAHALTAVEAFSTGRLLPLQENPAIHTLRLNRRRIGSAFEEKYASLTGPFGFSSLQRLMLYISLGLEPVVRLVGNLMQQHPKIVSYIKRFGEKIHRIFRT